MGDARLVKFRLLESTSHSTGDGIQHLNRICKSQEWLLTVILDQSKKLKHLAQWDLQIYVSEEILDSEPKYRASLEDPK